MKRWMGLVLLLALLLSACSGAEKPQERTEERGSGTTVERESDELAPNIPDDLRREALYLAGSYRDKALMDNDYAADGYARDMELEHIYAEAEKRLK